MVRSKCIVSANEVKEILSGEPDFLKALVTRLVQDVLEAEMEEALQAARSERCESRLGYRSEKALVATLAEMYIQGVSTRKVKAITEELCGHQFSASAVSSLVKRLDGQLKEFAERQPEEGFPYLILDARYEKVREGGAIRSHAVHMAIGIDWEGRRQVLEIEMSNRESANSWKDFLKSLRQRGLQRSGRLCPKRSGKDATFIFYGMR